MIVRVADHYPAWLNASDRIFFIVPARYRSGIIGLVGDLNTFIDAVHLEFVHNKRKRPCWRILDRFLHLIDLSANIRNELVHILPEVGRNIFDRSSHWAKINIIDTCFHALNKFLNGGQQPPADRITHLPALPVLQYRQTYETPFW